MGTDFDGRSIPAEAGLDERRLGAGAGLLKVEFLLAIIGGGFVPEGTPRGAARVFF